MNQPDDERGRGTQAVRVAGVGLGLLGATFGGVSGWFTLTPTAALAEPTVVTTHGATTTAGESGSVVMSATAASTPASAQSGRLRNGSGRAHTRTGGA